MKLQFHSLCFFMILFFGINLSWAQSESGVTDETVEREDAPDSGAESSETAPEEVAPEEVAPEETAPTETSNDVSSATTPESTPSPSTNDSPPENESESENGSEESEEESDESEEESSPASALGRYLKISGFVSASFFVQNSSFGFCNGQCSEWPLPDQVATDPWFVDGDVRNTRIRLDSKSPPVREIVFGATVEVDFFGGFPIGSFADEAPLPRLRLAFAAVTWRWLSLRVGQTWSPMLGNIPTSLSHIAFPLGYGAAGMVGWRFPGIYLDFNITNPDAPVHVQLQLAVFRGSWNGPGTITSSLSAGNADIPQFEARLNLSGEGDHGLAWNFYLVGHYDRKDLSGVGVELTDEDDDFLNGYAVEGGGGFKIWRFSLALNAYYGGSIGQQFGHITQFGDIVGWGLWTQLGFTLYEGLSIHAFYGIADPDDADVIGSYDPDDATLRPRLRNQIVSVMLKYTFGQFSFGVEWLYGRLDYEHRDADDPTSRPERTAEGHQVSISGLYRF